MCNGDRTVLCVTHMSVSPSSGQKSCSVGKQAYQARRIKKNIRGRILNKHMGWMFLSRLHFWTNPEFDWQHAKHLLWTHWLHPLAQWDNKGTPRLSQYTKQKLQICIFWDFKLVYSPKENFCLNHACCCCCQWFLIGCWFFMWWQEQIQPPCMVTMKV